MENSQDITLLVFDFFKLDKIFLFLFLVTCIFLGVKFVNLWSIKLQEKFSGRRLVILQMTTVFTFLSYLIGVASVFYFVFKPSRELLVAVGGSAAVAIGFALKDLVESMIAGFILLFDRPFQVGDRVSFGSVYGEIKNIGLRSVRLQTLNDDLVTIPNSKFLSDVVASGNSGDLAMMVVVNFHLSLAQDLGVIRDLLYEVVITSRYVYLEKPVKIVFEEVTLREKVAIKASVKSYVLDVKYEKDLVTDITMRGNQILNQHQAVRPG